jgi:hypothetical protein
MGERAHDIRSVLRRARTLGRRGLAVSLAATVVLVVLAAVAYAAVFTVQQHTPTLYRASGHLRIANSRGGDALVGMQGMAPGRQSTGTVRIGNAARTKAKFSLGLSHLSEKTGLGNGLLSLRLVLVVQRLSYRGRPVLVYRGPLRRMPLLNLGAFSPGQSSRFRFTVLFPKGDDAADDSYQGASLSLQFTWYARGVS